MRSEAASRPRHDRRNCAVSLDMEEKRIRNTSWLVAFGKTVSMRRKLLGLTQEEVGIRADLHRTYVADIERGARNISLLSLTRLANALEMSASSICFAIEVEVARLRTAD